MTDTGSFGDGIRIPSRPTSGGVRWDHGATGTRGGSGVSEPPSDGASAGRLEGSWRAWRLALAAAPPTQARSPGRPQTQTEINSVPPELTRPLMWGVLHRRALMKRSLVLTTLFALCATGCIVVHPGARTVLECCARPDGTDVIRLGFSDCTWSVVSNHVAVVAYGWHPREHETYAFFCNEPYPAFQPRWLLMSQLEASDQFQLDLWYTPSCTVQDRAYGNPSSAK